jgi:hypothetical protein
LRCAWSAAITASSTEIVRLLRPFVYDPMLPVDERGLAFESYVFEALVLPLSEKGGVPVAGTARSEQERGCEKTSHARDGVPE